MKKLIHNILTESAGVSFEVREWSDIIYNEITSSSNRDRIIIDGYENRQNKECKFLRLNNYINTQNSLDQMGNEFSGEAYLDSGEKVYIYHNFKSIETSAEHKYIRIYLYYSGFKYH